jgi:hypothetical protein
MDEVVVTKLVIDLSKPPKHPDRERVVPLTPAELEQRAKDAAAAPELDREVVVQMIDARLRSCDWTMLSDSGLSTADKAKWKTYRDALRKMVADRGAPPKTWPEPPAV